MHLIVGLGNPGKKYEDTRHNVGFKVIDRLSKDLDIPVLKEKCGALMGQGQIGGDKVMLAKPQTFMNLSGTSVTSLMQWFKFDPEKLILIYDDLDLDVGDLRIRPKGNSGGHKGVESVVSSVKITGFARVRIGIGRTGVDGDSADYVLSPVPKKEHEEIDLAIVRAADAVQMIISGGIEEAMNKFNSRA
ncbi:aminoacyl-tRNA hydrolase [Candidatus Margulisiibacteriota bacterium]